MGLAAPQHEKKRVGEGNVKRDSHNAAQPLRAQSKKNALVSQ